MRFAVPPRARLVGCVGLVCVLGLGGCFEPSVDEGDPFRFDMSFGRVVDLAGPIEPQPTFGATVEQTVTPPAISGGTLAVADGRVAIAADPDRDHVYVVDVAQGAVRADVALTAGDEPGRVALDGAGHAHVALRRGGALVTIDPATGSVLFRRAVCAAPRGVAYEPATDLVHVACAGGELVSLPATGGDAVRTLHLDRDLRDVVVSGGALHVTRLRTAELLTLALDGSIANRERPSQFTSTNVRNGDLFAPAVAWRTVPSPTGGMVMVHQRADTAAVATQPGGYGASSDDCGSGIVHGAVTTFDDAGGMTVGPALPDAVLPVDIAVSPGGTNVAIAVAGNAFTPGLRSVIEVATGEITGGPDCLHAVSVTRSGSPVGQVTAVAYLPSGELLVQSREPATLQVWRYGAPVTTIALSTVSRDDTGMDIFHANSGGGLACASCHAEAGDDGLVWQFATLGPRRTQSIRGGTLGKGPFHWSGDERDFTTLMTDVFMGRMSGPLLDAGQIAALANFADAQPPLPQSPPADPDAVARGEALFNDATVGCASCHGGASMTNRQILDVGTAGSFKTPSMIGVAWRAPFLHDGRAPTLTDRFNASLGGGDQHGSTSQLSSSQIADLVAYLETL